MSYDASQRLQKTRSKVEQLWGFDRTRLISDPVNPRCFHGKKQEEEEDVSKGMTCHFILAEQEKSKKKNSRGGTGSGHFARGVTSIDDALPDSPLKPAFRTAEGAGPMTGHER